MTEKNKGQYCHKCAHAREKVIPRCWICKLNCVQRNQTDVCLWDSKKNPSKFEPLSEDATEQELALALARDIPICKDCGDLVICDGDCRFKSRTEQIKENALREITQKLREFIKANREDGSCPFGSMNEGKCHEYSNDEDGGCSLCIFDHAIDSLIKGDPPK
jgi:radical SAM protein with 4Fe4S-binding SPASM domain